MLNQVQLENFLRRRYGPVKISRGKNGTEMLVRCPVCTKRKLSVNAKTGMYQCWHGCMAGHIDNLTGDTKIAQATTFAAAKPKQERGVDSPGELIPLTHLDEDHQAIVYLTRRGFDPHMLSTTYGICYCGAGKAYAGGLFNTSNTIMIPVYKDGALIAWQARLLYDPAKLSEEECVAMGFLRDEDGDIHRPPKYFTMPGFTKGDALWNYDWARKSEIVVVTEGVFDAIAVGRCAVACFGKGVSELQARTLNAYWKLVVLLLDPGDADKEMAKLLAMLDSAVVVNLQGYKDAGEAPQHEIWRQIDQTIARHPQLASAGLSLDKYRFIV